MLFLVNDILDYSKIEVGKLSLNFSEFSPSDLIQETINLLQFQASQRNIKINACIDKNVP